MINGSSKFVVGLGSSKIASIFIARLIALFDLLLENPHVFSNCCIDSQLPIAGDDVDVPPPHLS